MFDVNSFLNTEATGAMSTELVNVPEGVYTGVIPVEDGAIKIREDKEGGSPIREDKNGRPYINVDITWQFDDPAIAAVTKRQKNTARQSLFVRMTPAGHIDASEGENIELGRLRKALGMNDPSKPWSFTQMKGRAARCTVKHRIADNGRVYVDVTEVAAL